MRHSDTLVTTADGSKYVEDKNHVKTRLAATGNQFYVMDFKPDTQVGEIRPYLCLGSADVTGNSDLLLSMGVTHILNVSTIKMENFPDTFIYHNVPLLDIPQENLLIKLKECFEFIDSSRSSDGKVLVHCMAGISRSASVAIAYLMKQSGMTFDEALEEVKKYRPCANPNEGFKKQLRNWNHSLL